MNCFKNGPKNENFGRFYSLGRIRVSFLGQRGSVGQKVYIARFLDRVGHLGGVNDNQHNRNLDHIHNRKQDHQHNHDQDQNHDHDHIHDP